MHVLGVELQFAHQEVDDFAAHRSIDFEPHRTARPQPRRVAVAPEHAHVVRTGDNLWSIARTEIVRTTGDAHPSDAVIAAYWQRVIALNRATLRSGNPSLIFPGEIVALPTP